MHVGDNRPAPPHPDGIPGLGIEKKGEVGKEKPKAKKNEIGQKESTIKGIAERLGIQDIEDVTERQKITEFRTETEPTTIRSEGRTLLATKVTFKMKYDGVDKEFTQIVETNIPDNAPGGKKIAKELTDSYLQIQELLLSGDEGMQAERDAFIAQMGEDASATSSFCVQSGSNLAGSNLKLSINVKGGISFPFSSMKGAIGKKTKEGKYEWRFGSQEQRKPGEIFKRIAPGQHFDKNKGVSGEKTPPKKCPAEMQGKSAEQIAQMDTAKIDQGKLQDYADFLKEEIEQELGKELMTEEGLQKQPDDFSTSVDELAPDRLIGKPFRRAYALSGRVSAVVALKKYKGPGESPSKIDKLLCWRRKARLQQKHEQAGLGGIDLDNEAERQVVIDDLTKHELPTLKERQKEVRENLEKLAVVQAKLGDEALEGEVAAFQAEFDRVSEKLDSIEARLEGEKDKSKADKADAAFTTKQERRMRKAEALGISEARREAFREGLPRDIKGKDLSEGQVEAAKALISAHKNSEANLQKLENLKQEMEREASSIHNQIKKFNTGTTTLKGKAQSKIAHMTSTLSLEKLRHQQTTLVKDLIEIDTQIASLVSVKSKSKEVLRMKHLLFKKEVAEFNKKIERVGEATRSTLEAQRAQLVRKGKSLKAEFTAAASLSRLEEGEGIIMVDNPMVKKDPAEQQLQKYLEPGYIERIIKKIPPPPPAGDD